MSEQSISVANIVVIQGSDDTRSIRLTGDLTARQVISSMIDLMVASAVKESKLKEASDGKENSTANEGRPENLS